MPSIVLFFLILALILVVVLIVVTNIVIVPQSTVFVIERLGVYSSTWEAGLHVKIPFIERVAKKVSLKEQVGDFPPQPVITRDNVTIQIDTVVFFQVMDAKLYTYGVNQPIAALESLCATTLRNIIGEMELGPPPCPAGTSSTRRSPPSWTRPPTSGASRSTGWRSRTSCPPPRSRTPWRSR